METIVDLSTRIKQLSLDVEQQTVAVSELAVSFADSAQRQVRRDQATLLRRLKTSIMWEVENTRRMELAAQTGSIKGSLLGGAANFFLGNLFASAIGHDDAFKTGVKLAGSVLSKSVPFGTVFIAIGKEGLPEDLEIIPVSRFARESTKTEMEVEESWKHEGYLLVTPEQFSELLDKVEQALLDGSLLLPLARNEVMKQLPRQ